MDNKRLEDLLTQRLHKSKPSIHKFQTLTSPILDLLNEIERRLERSIVPMFPDDVMDKYGYPAIQEYIAMIRRNFQGVPIPTSPTAIENLADKLARKAINSLTEIIHAKSKGKGWAAYSEHLNDLDRLITRERELVRTPFGGGHEGVERAFDEGWYYTLGVIFEGVLERLGGYDKIGPEASTFIWNVLKDYEFMLKAECRRFIREWADTQPESLPPYAIWSKMDDWSRTTGAAIAVERVRSMAKAASQIPNL